MGPPTGVGPLHLLVGLGLELPPALAGHAGSYEATPVNERPTPATLTTISPPPRPRSAPTSSPTRSTASRVPPARGPGRASSSSKRPPEARYGNFAMTGSLKTPST